MPGGAIGKCWFIQVQGICEKFGCPVRGAKGHIVWTMSSTLQGNLRKIRLPCARRKRTYRMDYVEHLQGICEKFGCPVRGAKGRIAWTMSSTCKESAKNSAALCARKRTYRMDYVEHLQGICEIFGCPVRSEKDISHGLCRAKHTRTKNSCMPLKALKSINRLY